MQEARRKKEREEQAVQVYHLQLLREGVERLLRFAAGMKAFRQQLHAQQQVQVGLGCPHPPSPVGHGRHSAALTAGRLQAAHSLHRAVHRCATLWKQKALGRGRELQSPVKGSRELADELNSGNCSWVLEGIGSFNKEVPPLTGRI